MTIENTDDDVVLADAVLAAQTPPAIIVDAAGLPDGVKNGEVNPDADDGTDIHTEEP